MKEEKEVNNSPKFTSLEDLENQSHLSCPLCGHRYKIGELIKKLSRKQVTKKELLHLKQMEINGGLKVMITSGIQMTKTLFKIGEPTINFQENFEALNKKSKEIGDAAKNLLEREENLQETNKCLRKEQDKLNDMKEEIKNIEKAKIPETVKEKLIGIQKQMIGQLSSIDNKISKLMHEPRSSGKRQEFDLDERARKLNLGDDVIPKGGRSEEDLEIKIVSNERVKGNLVIESKNVKHHRKNHIKKLKKYKEKKGADIGLLVTTDMPKEARNEVVDYWNFGDGILVLRPEFFEAAYLLVRYGIIRSKEAENKYEKKQESLERERSGVQETLKKILEEVDTKNLIKMLNKVMERIESQNEQLHNLKDHTSRELNKAIKNNRNIIMNLLDESLRQIKGFDSILKET